MDRTTREVPLNCLRQVLGMTKCHLDLKGAKHPKIELDFLRLLFAVREIRRNGGNAVGYLLVTTSEISDRVSQWRSKYGADDTDEVFIEPAKLSDSERVRLNRQAQAARKGMLVGSQGGKAGSLADASPGADLMESKLTRMIEKREPDICRITDPPRFPLSIRWDYYGVRELAGREAQRRDCHRTSTSQSGRPNRADRQTD